MAFWTLGHRLTEGGSPGNEGGLHSMRGRMGAGDTLEHFVLRTGLTHQRARVWRFSRLAELAARAPERGRHGSFPR